MKYTVERWPRSRNWVVYQVLPDGMKNIVAVTVYKRGAENVARLLNIYQDILKCESEMVK